LKVPDTRQIIFRQEVIEQTIQPLERVEIQPVVNLEREQTEVHEIVQPFVETEVLPANIEEKSLPVIEKEEIRESEEEFKKEYRQITEGFKSKVDVNDIRKERIVKAPIVNEVIHKKVIEEIQPVIHKETIVPKVIKELQPIHERIVEAPKLVKEDYENKSNLEELQKQGVKVESITKKAIIEDTLKPIETVEIQPVINLERDQTEIHEVIMPIYKTEVLPATIEEKELLTIEKETVVQSEDNFNKEYKEMIQQLQSNVKMETVERSRIVKPPIIQEVIHKRIIEEIQPVIHKETIVPHIIKETLPMHERLVEAPVLIKETLPEKNLGITFIEDEGMIDRTVLETKKVA